MPDDDIRIVRSTANGVASGNEAPFRPLMVGIKVTTAFEPNAIQSSGEAFEFVHQRFSDPLPSSFGGDTKVSDGCHTVGHAVEKIAENLILCVGGHKQSALGNALLERPPWHEAKSAGMFSI